MHNRLLGFFEKRGDQTAISDLYASGFQPAAAKWDFKTSGGPHQNYMMEQQRAAAKGDGEFAEDIQQEIARLRAADLLVLEFPLWWSAPPAVVKGWFDKVFALGIVWDGNSRYAKGLLKGKQVLVVTEAGDSEQHYSPEGIHKATVVQHLYPLLHSTLAHAGLDVLRPHIAYGVTASNEEDRNRLVENMGAYLEKFSTSPEFLYKH